jgi:glucose/arabinose dehydrogenase
MRLYRNIFTVILILFINQILFAQNPNIQLTQAFPNLTFTGPLYLTYSNDGTNRIFVLQQNGIIKVFPNDSNVTLANAKTFLDISNKISASSGEEGLLGLTFHPNFTSNGYFYIDYTAPNPLHTVIARFKVSSGNPDKADSLSEYQILTINQPFTNHNGGTVMFGMDGYLYIGMGDGGSGGDPNNNAQNTQVLLGKILRLNVNDTTPTTRYTIPSSNPFYNNPSAGRGEIFCWGMRNPWKYTQDAVTGLIYCGDVGQNIWEEVDIIQAGKNYGWRITEGYACYNPPTNCDTTGITMPIKVYGHTGGSCSITGGYVYRGGRRPELQGAYIYGDYCSGMVRMLRYNSGTVTSDSLLTTLPSSLSSFGIDQFNELYFVGYSSGKIYRFNKSARALGINNNENNIPGSYNLFQNYPNPFNPSTVISYALPENAFVTLKVYNILGREVSTLVNTFQTAGNYNINFSLTESQIASGIYFYTLSTQKFNMSKRMLVLK